MKKCFWLESIFATTLLTTLTTMQFITEAGQPDSANRLATCWGVEGSIPTKDQVIPDQPNPLSTDIVRFYIWDQRVNLTTCTNIVPGKQYTQIYQILH